MNKKKSLDTKVVNLALVVIFLIAVLINLFNEYRSYRDENFRNSVKDNMTVSDHFSLSADHDGRIVLFSGNVLSMHGIYDDFLGVEVDALIYKRRIEEKPPRCYNKYCRNSFSAVMDTNGKRISGTMVAPMIYMGAYRVSYDLLETFPEYTFIPKEAITAVKDLNKEYEIKQGAIYIVNPRNSMAVGRWTFERVFPGRYTLLARVKNGVIYRAPGDVSYVLRGSTSVEQLKKVAGVRNNIKGILYGVAGLSFFVVSLLSSGNLLREIFRGMPVFDAFSRFPTFLLIIFSAATLNLFVQAIGSLFLSGASGLDFALLLFTGGFIVSYIKKKRMNFCV